MDQKRICFRLSAFLNYPPFPGYLRILCIWSLHHFKGTYQLTEYYSVRFSCSLAMRHYYIQTIYLFMLLFVDHTPYYTLIHPSILIYQVHIFTQHISISCTEQMTDVCTVQLAFLTFHLEPFKFYTLKPWRQDVLMFKAILNRKCTTQIYCWFHYNITCVKYKITSNSHMNSVQNPNT